MFRKIISNLSFSSALVGQLGFYAKRLRKEETTRRVGLIFVVLALVVQSLVVFQPPEPANAASAGDFVYGGLGLGSKRSLNNFLNPYDANSGNLKDIMNFTGITREEIANAKFGSFLTSSNQYSWGRVANVGTQPVRITNSTGEQTLTTVYARDITIANGKNTRIYGWIGHSAKVGWFAIMQACGNLVTNVIPTPPVPPKKCTVEGKRNLNADDPNCYVNCDKPGKSSLKITDPNCYVNCIVSGKNHLRADDPNCFVNCTATGKTNLKATDPNCFVNCVVPGKTNLQSSDPNCFVNCTITGKTSLKASDPNCYVNCDVPGKTDLRATDPNCFVNCTIEGKTNLKATDPDCKIDLCTYEGKTNVPANSVLCVPPAPGNIEQSKSATNVSQGAVDAEKVTAQSGDRINYTISVKNTGGSPITASFRDNISDSLEYATLVDYGGGTFDEKTQTLSWNDITLATGETQARTFTLKLKDTIPATPQGQSEPISYDCRMMNSFGNITDIKVDCPVTKTVENIVTELPKTGAAENMTFAGIVLAIVVYFYLRSRLLGKEVRLIRRDLNAGAI